MLFLFLTFVLLTFQFYEECTSVNITKPNVDELREDLEWIIHREEKNLKHLEDSYKKFTSYYLSQVGDLEFEGTLVRHQEIVEDTLVDIKLKLHQVSNIQESAECYSEALDDLTSMFDKFKRDYDQCSKSAYATFDRLRLDFTQFKKASKRITRRLKKILKVCSLKKDTESALCKRQYIPIKDLNLLANHTYQYERRNVGRTDDILQSLRNCNVDAIRPASELAMHFVDTLDKECDFENNCL